MSKVAFDLKIESADEEIVFDKDTANAESEAITDVTFKMNTLNDSTLNRANAVRCELIIKGTINKGTKEETMKLTKWSMATNGENSLYRKVTVTVYTDGGREEVLRQYTVDKMFCIDYDEIFGGNKDDGTGSETGTFTLYIAQREGSYSKDVFAN